jgi:hypothetical protein
MTNHETISAFIDGEPVDPVRLADALGTPAGREYLVDLLRLGALVAEAEKDAGGEAPRSVGKEKRRWLVAAAAVLLMSLGAFAAGMQVGQQVLPASTTAQQQDAPLPDRVIELRDGIEWRNNLGGM